LKEGPYTWDYQGEAINYKKLIADALPAMAQTIKKFEVTDYVPPVAS
jgi:hypothetical protein